MANSQFTPLNKSIVHIVNWATHTDTLYDILRSAQQTKFFSIDTEGDFKTNQPAIIEIELINRDLSQVLLIEMCHLPKDRTCLQFWLIRSIFKFVLQSSKTIYVWGDGIKELSQFIDFKLFNLDLLKQSRMVNLQRDFGRWHRNQIGLAIKGNNLWGLQAAIGDQFGEHLDKRLRLNRWSQSFTFVLKKKGMSVCQSMIDYCANDCLAVTKLADRMNYPIE